MSKIDKKLFQRSGYFLILNDQASIKDIHEDLEELFEQIKKDNKLEKSFELTIDTGNRILSDKAKEDLMKLQVVHMPLPR